MARFPTFIVAALLAAITFTAPLLARQADDGQRPARKPPTVSTPQAQPRRPPAQKPLAQTPPAQQRQPPSRPAPRPPVTSQAPRPTERAMPRPPAFSRPRVTPGDRTWIYAFYPPLTFDLIYGFPYGLYPYWTYGDPYGDPYGLSYSSPLPDCPPEAAEAVAHAAVRFDVPQKDAAVYVDSYYVGVVNNFSGATPPLDLLAGPHRIEIRAPGFETLTFFVNPEPGHAITYRGALQPVRR